jgi:hypothetical protein
MKTWYILPLSVDLVNGGQVAIKVTNEAPGYVGDDIDQPIVEKVIPITVKFPEMRVLSPQTTHSDWCVWRNGQHRRIRWEMDVPPRGSSGSIGSSVNIRLVSYNENDSGTRWTIAEDVEPDVIGSDTIRGSYRWHVGERYDTPLVDDVHRDLSPGFYKIEISLSEYDFLGTQGLIAESTRFRIE